MHSKRRWGEEKSSVYISVSRNLGGKTEKCTTKHKALHCANVWKITLHNTYCFRVWKRISSERVKPGGVAQWVESVDKPQERPAFVCAGFWGGKLFSVCWQSGKIVRIFLSNNVGILLFGYIWLVVILGMMERRARELVLCVSNADKGSLTSELY